MASGVPYELPWIAETLRELKTALVGVATPRPTDARILQYGRQDLENCANALERIHRDTNEKCPRCNGTGQPTIAALDENGMRVSCVCDGTGLVRIAFEHSQRQLHQARTELQKLRDGLRTVLDENKEE